MPDEQTPTPHLEKLFREVAEDEFWAIRGRQSMVMLIWNNLYANCLIFG